MNGFKLNVGSEPYQIIDFNFFDERLRMTLTFNSLSNRWFMSLEKPNENEVICQSVALVCGVRLLERMNLPYFMVIYDNSENGLDPSHLTDFENRCSLFLFNKEQK